jgi:hypothetical protein
VINVLYNNQGIPYYITKTGGSIGGSVSILPLGPKNLNDMVINGDIFNKNTGIAATSPIINTDTLSYEYYLTSKDERVTEKVIVNVDHNCYKHDGVEFLYLGELGTFESYTFRMADIKSFKTGRNEVKSNQYSINSNQYTYNIGDRGRKNVNVSSTESHDVISGWISDEESTDILELIASPEVYIKKDGEIYPIILTTTGYEHKTIRNNKLYNYTIKFDMAFEKLSNI